ncbi:hypothetical protein [Nocardia sp. bgisy134]|uniref:hypothetical protein n=1 Tax=unclassified Nocardia TaxID=2637762 RepID=UPI003D71D617
MRGGPDAEPLRGTPLAEVVHEVALAAEDAGDIELIALWHAPGVDVLLGVAGTEDPRRMRATRAVRAIALRTDAIAFDLPDGYRPPPEFTKTTHSNPGGREPIRRDSTTISGSDRRRAAPLHRPSHDSWSREKYSD